MKVFDRRIVSISYRITSDEGHIVDLVLSDDPYVYRHGSGQLPVAVEERLRGLGPGDKVLFTLSESECYGRRREEGEIRFPRQEVPDQQVPLLPGAAVVLGTAEYPGVHWIREVGDKEVVLDAQDPLAGKSLHFAISILEVVDSPCEPGPNGPTPP